MPLMMPAPKIVATMKKYVKEKAKRPDAKGRATDALSSPVGASLGLQPDDGSMNGAVCATVP